MFQKADLVLLTKIDLIPHLDFDVTAVQDALCRVMPGAQMLQVSARTGEGIDEWLHWLEQRRPAPSTHRTHTHHDHVHDHAEEHSHEPR